MIYANCRETRNVGLKDRLYSKMLKERSNTKILKTRLIFQIINQI